MSTHTQDLLMQPLLPPDRVHYATGVLLDAHDFREEQAYHRGRLARALRYLHGSGTAAGLRVVWEASLGSEEDPGFPEGREEQLRIEAGLAIDRLGRMIEVPRAICIRLGRWYDAQDADDLRRARHDAPIPGMANETLSGVVADVFVRFTACERGKTPAFATGPFDATNAAAPSRLRDAYEASLVLRQEATPPLPLSPWPTPDTHPDGQTRREALHEAILDAWDAGTADWAHGQPAPLNEHAAGQDTTDVLLARLVIPVATEGPAERVLTTPVEVNNTIRPFVYTTDAIGHAMGLSRS